MTGKFDFYSRVVKFSGRSVNLIIESQSLRVSLAMTECVYAWIKMHA